MVSRASSRQPSHSWLARMPASRRVTRCWCSVENQQAGALFDQWLERHTSDVVESIVQAYDFARVSAVADVGGGLGSLLAAVLKAYPTLRGALADHPAVVNSARDSLAALGLLDRCEIHAVDFFEAV